MSSTVTPSFDRLRTRAGAADAFEDGGQVAGVGRGEVGDGFDVVKEGEAVGDKDLGLGEGVGGEGGGALGGESPQMT